MWIYLTIIIHETWSYVGSSYSTNHESRPFGRNLSVGYNHSRITTVRSRISDSSNGYNHLWISAICSLISAFPVTIIHKPRPSMGNSSVGTLTLISTTSSNNWLSIHESPPVCGKPDLDQLLTYLSGFTLDSTPCRPQPGLWYHYWGVTRASTGSTMGLIWVWKPI